MVGVRQRAATLYHLLTGRPPFQDANAMWTMMQVQI
jgi:hypothetical protein